MNQKDRSRLTGVESSYMSVAGWRRGKDAHLKVCRFIRAVRRLDMEEAAVLRKALQSPNTPVMTRVIREESADTL